MAVLNTTEQAVSVILGEMDFGEPMAIEPHIEEHTVTVGYLLTWRLVLSFFVAASSQVRSITCYNWEQTIVMPVCTACVWSLWTSWKQTTGI